MIKRIVFLLLPLVLLLARPAFCVNESGNVLHLTLGDPIESEMGQLGQAFKAFVEERSHGTVTVEITYGGRGPGEDEAFQFHRVQTGKLDMAFGGVANLEPMVNPLGVLTLPYLFSNLEEVVRGTTGEAARLLNSYAENAGLRILAWTYCGFRNISNSKRSITNLNDLHGLRIRVPQSLVMLETYRALGAIPSPIDWNMTWNALKNNEVDGQCYDYNGFRAMKFHEAGQKYITEMHYLYLLQPLVISQQVFERMHPAMQAILLEAGRHVQELSLHYQEEMSTKVKEELQKEGVQISTLTDEAAWRKLAREKVWPRVARHMGGTEVINAYLKAAGLPLWQ